MAVDFGAVPLPSHCFVIPAQTGGQVGAGTAALDPDLRRDDEVCMLQGRDDEVCVFQGQDDGVCVLQGQDDEVCGPGPVSGLAGGIAC